MTTQEILEELKRIEVEISERPIKPLKLYLYQEQYDRLIKEFPDLLGYDYVIIKRVGE